MSSIRNTFDFVFGVLRSGQENLAIPHSIKHFTHLRGEKTLVGEIKYWRLFVSLAFWKINKILNSAPCAYKRVFLPVIFGVFQISQQYCLCHFLTFWFLYSYWKWLEIKKKERSVESTTLKACAQEVHFDSLQFVTHNSEGGFARLFLLPCFPVWFGVVLDPFLPLCRVWLIFMNDTRTFISLCVQQTRKRRLSSQMNPECPYVKWTFCISSSRTL